MKKTIACMLIATCMIGNSSFAQTAKIVSFANEQKMYQKDIQSFLTAKANRNSEAGVFASDLQCSTIISCIPTGQVFDSTYFGPKPVGDKIDTATLRKDTVYFIKVLIDSGSQKAAIYNAGQTMVYNFRAIVTVYAFGNLATFKVNRLETYIRYQGRWLFVAGSGTEYNPKWMPTPIRQ